MINMKKFLSFSNSAKSDIEDTNKEDIDYSVEKGNDHVSYVDELENDELENDVVEDEADVMGVNVEDIHSEELRSKLFYGVLSDFVNIICGESEALEMALASEIITAISISIPSGYLWTPYAMTKTTPRLNTIIVADTGAGKGLSTSQFNIIRERINEKYPGLVTPYLMGGIKTIEGVISKIRDVDEDKNNNHEIVDSVGNQLLIHDEEISRMFISAKKKPDISQTLRGFFDGVEVASNTKYNPIKCKKPHVGMFGHISKEELGDVVNDIDIYNGFLNRFVLIYDQRTKSIPFPPKIEDKSIDYLVEKLSDIINWTKEEEREMKYSECYIDLYSKKYEELRNLGENKIEKALLTRGAKYTAMYAMIFAALDKSTVIDKGHLESALAWVNVWEKSVKYIYQSYSQSILNENNLERKKKIIEFINREIKSKKLNSIGKTPITKAFSGKYSSKEITETLKELQLDKNSKIKIVNKKRNAMEISIHD
ncbi:hypothetical protein WOB79_17240 [Vibrio parahaemolyticus]|nr:hypothetical protein [Vibrio parahaemolyticus]ELA7159094.1 hypothetical protein [Vibrio parahaemolyticus]